MKKSEYTTWESLPKKIKQIIYAHLQACSIIKTDDKATNNAIMRTFHEQICVNNKLFPANYEIEGVYRLFIEWLSMGDHNESTFNIFHHQRAFKAFMEFKNKPTTKYYNANEPVKLDIPTGKGRRVLNVSVERCKEAIRVCEMMDEMTPDSQAIGGKLKGGKKWTEFNYYLDALYTIQVKTGKANA
jgi:hypothetical protein